MIYNFGRRTSFSEDRIKIFIITNLVNYWRKVTWGVFRRAQYLTIVHKQHSKAHGPETSEADLRELSLYPE
jgi:hypothetical protein